MCLKTILIMERTKANKIAQPKLSTTNPGTIKLASQTKNALITNVNKPRVNIVTGKVSKIRIGLINKFKAPNTTAKIKAAKKPETATCGNKYAAIIIAMLETSQWKISFILFI